MKLKHYLSAYFHGVITHEEMIDRAIDFWYRNHNSVRTPEQDKTLEIQIQQAACLFDDFNDIWK